MKIIFFGLGSIGRRHAHILQKDFSHQLFAFRSGKKGMGNPLGIPEVTRWTEVTALRPDVAFITNPTSDHVRTALVCARRGMHLFIEKPLSDRMAGLEDLIGICRRKHLTAYVAYCLRFHPVIKKIRQLLREKDVRHVRVVCSSLLHRWRPGEDSKKSYSAHQAKGGGVILDLSHEFDYIHYLFGPVQRISGIKGRKGQVTVDAEDFADAVVVTENGITANVHLNFASQHDERTIAIDFKGGFLSGDLLSGRIILHEKNAKKQWDLHIPRDEYLRAQMSYFFKNIHNPRLMNHLSEARVLLKKILEFRNG